MKTKEIQEIKENVNITNQYKYTPHNNSNNNIINNDIIINKFISNKSENIAIHNDEKDEDDFMDFLKDDSNF